MIKKTIFLGVLLFYLVLCFGGTHDPWDGTKWDITSPDIDQPMGNTYKEIYDLRKGIAIRMNKEHETLAGSSAGGVQLQGSARAFFQDTAPTTQVNGDAWDSGDTGSFWFDTNASPDNQFFVLTDPCDTGTWTPISTEVIAVMVAAAHSWADVQTFDLEAIFTLGLTANGDITLGDANDLIGSATSDILFNTDKFTVEGATGNTVIAGTLGVTGVATLGDGSVLAAATDPNDADLTIADKKYVDDQCDAHIGVAGQYHVDGTTEFNTTLTAASTFQDLDLSGTIGANGALCFFEITADTSTYHTFNMRTKGYGGAFSKHEGTYGSSNCRIAGAYYAYLTCAADASGIVQIAAGNDTVTYTIKLIGYIK